MTTRNSLNQGLCEFIANSPTPFHAVQNLSKRLKDAGYQELYEGDAWQLQAGQAYYVCRNASSLIAFRTSENTKSESMRYFLTPYGV